MHRSCEVTAVEKSALVSRSISAPEQATSPPELSPAKQALAEELMELEFARDKLLGAHEVLAAYEFASAELVKVAIDDVEAQIEDLTWRITAPEGEREE